MPFSENSSVVKMTPRDLGNIHTVANSFGDTFHARHGSKITLVLLGADQKPLWSLFLSSVSLL